MVKLYIEVRRESVTTEEHFKRDKIKMENATSKHGGPNPVASRIREIDQRIAAVKKSAEEALAVLYEQYDEAELLCNHRDDNGKGIMEGFVYSICPLCGYTA